MSDTDAWIENRIRFKAGQHSLPAGRTQFFGDAEESVKRSVRMHLKESHGVPVLLAFDSPDRWSVIATRQFVGLDDGRLRSCALADVESINSRDLPPAPPAGLLTAVFRRRKRSWEYLSITLVDGSTVDLWVPAGPEAFAFWNILQGVTRIAAQRRPT